jgi:hypothetical protein
VTALERHCRWLLRAYPAWYRRDRAEEMLGTLLEASPPSRRWPSFRDARALAIGSLRARGWAFFLSVVWVGAGAAGAAYIFLLSTHVSANLTCRIPCWVGEPGAAVNAGYLGAAAWLVLAIPALAAGLIRFNGLATPVLAWSGAWIAGVALMVAVARWQTSAPAVWACSGNQGCSLAGYRYAVVSWGELPICAAWLALGAVMMLMLARTTPTRARSHRAVTRT